MTGGYGAHASNSIEIHDSDGTTKCLRSDNVLLEDIAQHTQTFFKYTSSDTSNHLKYQVCGGNFAGSSGICQTYDDGNIQQSSLAYERAVHVSWNSDEGLILMGGIHSPSTTGLLTPTATESVPHFGLNYPLVGSVLISNLNCLCII